MLGVELDLTNSKQGIVKTRNKQYRVEDIKMMLDKIVLEGKVKPRELPSQLGCTENSLVMLGGSQVSALKLLRRRVASGEPRSLTARPSAKPFIIFTDGALEYDTGQGPIATIGGILLTPEGETRCFGSKVPEEMLNRWQTDGKEHVIGLVELYACVTALYEWRDLLRDHRILLLLTTMEPKTAWLKDPPTSTHGGNCFYVWKRWTTTFSPTCGYRGYHPTLLTAPAGDHLASWTSSDPSTCANLNAQFWIRYLKGCAEAETGNVLSHADCQWMQRWCEASKTKCQNAITMRYCATSISWIDIPFDRCRRKQVPCVSDSDAHMSVGLQFWRKQPNKLFEMTCMRTHDFTICIWYTSSFPATTYGIVVCAMRVCQGRWNHKVTAGLPVSDYGESDWNFEFPLANDVKAVMLGSLT